MTVVNIRRKTDGELPLERNVGIPTRILSGLIRRFHRAKQHVRRHLPPLRKTSTIAGMIQVKRVYEPPEKKDGYRVLVDRLWARGLSKSSAKVDYWAKDAAPSTDLRKWFDHDPTKWTEFEKRYERELRGSGALTDLRSAAREHKQMTLLFSAKDREHNNAVALKKILEK